MYYIILFLIFILFKTLRSYRRVKSYTNIKIHDHFDNHGIYMKEMMFSKFYDIQLENLFKNYP